MSWAYLVALYKKYRAFFWMAIAGVVLFQVRWAAARKGKKIAVKEESLKRVEEAFASKKEEVRKAKHELERVRHENQLRSAARQRAAQERLDDVAKNPDAAASVRRMRNLFRRRRRRDD